MNNDEDRNDNCVAGASVPVLFFSLVFLLPVIGVAINYERRWGHKNPHVAANI